MSVCATFCPHIVVPILILPMSYEHLTKIPKFQNHYFRNQRSYQKSDTAKRFLGYQTPSGKALAFFNFRALALTVWEIQPLEVLNFWNLIWLGHEFGPLSWDSYWVEGFILGRGLHSLQYESLSPVWITLPSMNQLWIATKVSTSCNIIATINLLLRSFFSKHPIQKAKGLISL